MTFRSNAHTHTTWCDGKNTPREMVEAALALGFRDLGFSGHAPAPFDEGFLGTRDEAGYRAEIAELKVEYAGRIALLCGAEEDQYATVDRANYDFIILSAHYLPKERADEKPVVVDDTPEELAEALRTRYGGDGLAMVRDYYDFFAKSIVEVKPDIVGHYDLITKLNGPERLFDEHSDGYRRIALEHLDIVIDALRDYGGMVEINTSALARGKQYPYASAPYLLARLREKNARVIITSDCHNTRHLARGFDEAHALLLAAGFRSMAVLQNGAFSDVNI